MESTRKDMGKPGLIAQGAYTGGSVLLTCSAAVL